LSEQNQLPYLSNLAPCCAADVDLVSTARGEKVSQYLYVRGVAWHLIER